MANPALSADGGSFKDPAGRVYRLATEAGESRILRGLNDAAATTMARLLSEPFFRRLVADRDVVKTMLLDDADPTARRVMAESWAVVAEHDAVPFVTQPYEWPFAMLKDAALLQLRLLETSVQNGWILKDATPFNIQWMGTRPVFIDVPSFVPWEGGEYWPGYRQFCATFLTPLLLTAHLGIPFQPLLRSRLEGIPPEEADRYFYGLRRFKRGVLSHIWFPARAEGIVRKRAGKGSGSRRRQSRTTLLALLDSLRRLVARLSYGTTRSDWSQYAGTHSYDDADFARKRDFVLRHTAAHCPGLTWDLGANTGEFSRLAAGHSGTVIAVDRDQDAVELLYRQVKTDGPQNIVPLVMDLANLSPGQGWTGRERPAFDQRRNPDLALCLALVHHLRVSANIPLPLFLDWLHGLNATVILEFVGRDDEMFQKLLENKREDYADYNAASFEREVRARFSVCDRLQLKDGARELLLLEPLPR